MTSAIRLVVSFAFLALVACGGHGGGAGQAAPQASVPTPAPAPAPTPTPTPTPAPTVLAGSSTQLASAALLATDEGPVATADIVQGHLLTRLFVALAADATVAQVNAAANAVGATAIAFSTPGSLLLTLDVPRQAGIADLYRLVDLLKTQPGIRFASPAREFATSMLPEASPGQPVLASELHHLLLTRFPAAWNARGAGPVDCRSRTVPIYVADRFGDFHARPNFFNQFDRTNYFEDGIEVGLVDGHGFDVVTTLAGKFDGAKPTGANPFKDCVSIREIEAINRSDVEVMRRILDRVSLGASSPFILNISLNFPAPMCGPAADQPCNEATLPLTPVDRLRDELIRRALLGDEWSKFMNSHPELENKMLITQSSGNRDHFLVSHYFRFIYAQFYSVVGVARIVPSIDQELISSDWEDDAPNPNIMFSLPDATAVKTNLNPLIAYDPSNVLMVNGYDDADINFNDYTAYAYGPLFHFVGAVGKNVVLADGPPAKGTSLAAPQVAGLAAYLWMLDDSLRGERVAKTIELLQNADQSQYDSLARVNVLDAYGAVLALDARNHNTKIRKALLDVNNDGKFDHLDLVNFQAAYDLQNPNRPSIPSSLDYSRFDLNGDGATGGIITAAFDVDASPLNADGRVSINTVERQIEGYPISFNEAALSDIQVLCAYAYSDLYEQATDELDERTRILGIPNCVSPRLDAVLPSPITVSQRLDTTVTMPSSNGQYAPAANKLVEFTATGGSVNPVSAQTNSSGVASTTVMAAAGSTLVSVTASVRASPGGVILAQKTVSATVAGQPQTLGIIGSYDGTQTAECPQCDEDQRIVTTSERWYLNVSVNAGKFRLGRVGGNQGACGVPSNPLPYDACTLDFEVNDGLPPPLNPFTTPGGPFSASDSNGDSLSGSVGGGQINFAHTFCSPGTSHECQSIKFNGTQPIRGATPSSLSFGTVGIGSTKTLTARLTNSGLFPLTVVIYFAPDDTQFVAKLPNTCPNLSSGVTCLELAPGATGTVEVKFTPTRAGDFQSALQLDPNTNEAIFIPLTGKGI